MPETAAKLSTHILYAIERHAPDINCIVCYAMCSVSCMAKSFCVLSPQTFYSIRPIVRRTGRKINAREHYRQIWCTLAVYLSIADDSLQQQQQQHHHTRSISPSLYRSWIRIMKSFSLCTRSGGCWALFCCVCVSVCWYVRLISSCLWIAVDGSTLTHVDTATGMPNAQCNVGRWLITWM